MLHKNGKRKLLRNSKFREFNEICNSNDDSHDYRDVFGVFFCLFVRFAETVSVITHHHHETCEIFPDNAQSEGKKGFRL